MGRRDISCPSSDLVDAHELVARVRRRGASTPLPVAYTARQVPSNLVVYRCVKRRNIHLTLSGADHSMTTARAKHVPSGRDGRSDEAPGRRAPMACGQETTVPQLQ